MSKAITSLSPHTHPELSNYKIAKEHARKLFCEYDPAKLAEKRNILFKEGYLYLDFLDRSYRIHGQTGYTEWFGHGFANRREADFEETMILYDILCYSKPFASPANEFLLINQLSQIQNAASYPGYGLFQKEERLLDGKTELLVWALERMRGIPWGKGDVSFRLPVFQSLDVIFSFWNSDEDFPPQIQLFCDRNILQYMHYETIWYLAVHIIKRIKELINDPETVSKDEVKRQSPDAR